MFGSKKLIKQYEERIKELTSLYEARISDLKQQVSDYRKLSIPSNESVETFARSIEADAVLSGNDHTITIPTYDSDEMKDIDTERDRILSGMY